MVSEAVIPSEVEGSRPPERRRLEGAEERLMDSEAVIPSEVEESRPPELRRLEGTDGAWVCYEGSNNDED
jgi:hypothetical protein